MILKNAIAECVWGAGWHARGDGWRGHWHVHPMSTTLEKYSANERSYTYLILPLSIIFYSGVWNALPTKSWNQCMSMLLCSDHVMVNCCDNAAVSVTMSRKIPENIKQCQDPRNQMTFWYDGMMIVWWYAGMVGWLWYDGVLILWNDGRWYDGRLVWW